MVSGILASSLQTEIDHLASTNAAPSFKPHVTIMAGAEATEHEILALASELAAQLKVKQDAVYCCQAVPMDTEVSETGWCRSTP